MVASSSRINHKIGQIMILAIMCIVSSLCEEASLDVIIENSQGYFYSKQCQLTFSVISNAYQLQPTNSQTVNTTAISQTFLLKIPNTSADKLSFSQFEPPYIHLTNGKIIKPSENSKCMFNQTSTFYCLTIVYSPITSAFQNTRFDYNQTHKMYKFTLKNIICPSYGDNVKEIGTEIEVKIVKNQTYVEKIGGVFPIIWKHQLGFIYARSLEFVGFMEEDHGGYNKALIINRIADCGAQLQFSFVVDNRTLEHSWQKISVIFETDADISDIEFQQDQNSKLICLIHSDNQEFPLNNRSQLSTECNYKRQSKLLQITNPNFLVLENPLPSLQIDKFKMYDYPITLQSAIIPQKFTIKTPPLKSLSTEIIKINIIIHGMHKNTISQEVESQIYFASQRQILMYSISESQYQKLNQNYLSEEYLQECRMQFSQREQESVFDDMVPDVDVLSQEPVFQMLLAVIILLVVIAIRFRIKPQFYTPEKFIYFTILIFDQPLKITLLIITASISNLNSIHFFLQILFLTEILFGLSCCLSYIFYIIQHRKYIANKKQIQKAGFKSSIKNKSIIAIILLLLYNYKFYCVFLNKALLSRLDSNSEKWYRLRNKQLYIKHSYHLMIQWTFKLIGMAGIYLVSQTDHIIMTKNLIGIQYELIDSVGLKIVGYIYCGFQFVLCYFVALCARDAYFMLELKKIKAKVVEIINHRA